MRGKQAWGHLPTATASCRMVAWSSSTMTSGEQLLRRFSKDFLGLDALATVVRVDGTTGATRRVYLDSAATCLMPRPVMLAVDRYLETSCANSHTHATTSGITTTVALDRTHAIVGRLVGCDPTVDCVILTGSGATAALNLLAQALFRDRLQERPLAVVSSQEHHSNLLPWIRHAGQQNVRFVPTRPDGSLDLAALDEILRREGKLVRVVAVTALSNVTGVVNPVGAVAEMAHRHGAEIAVDAAQAGAHVPITMHHGPGPDPRDLDYVALSGHKLYAPGSPGVLVGKRAPFVACGWSVGQVGGGTVEYVGLDGVKFKPDPSERQEAGTPNIPGAIALGVAVGILEAVGIDAVRAHERLLMNHCLHRFSDVPGIVVYGPTSAADRAAVLSFNLGGMHHGLVASVLNDYFGIAVRNDCFCAQPYVRSQIFSACDDRGYCEAAQLKHRGMVRASFGVYTTVADVDALADALVWVQKNSAWVATQYRDDGSGNFSHNTFMRPLPFSVDAEVLTYASKASRPLEQPGLLRLG